MVYMKYNRCVTVVTAMAIALAVSAYLYLSTIIPMRRPYSACDTASS